jgi:hemolysin activation/secretion protein
MKKQVQSLWYLGALVLFLSLAISLNAQTQQTQQPEPQAQQPPQQAQPEPAQQAQPDKLPDQSGKQAPDAQAQSPTSSQPSGVQTFSGTIVKSGNKYMFQDAATGNTYDIDHQDEVQKFEGKKVTVHGTLDAAAKMIHVQGQ